MHLGKKMSNFIFLLFLIIFIKYSKCLNQTPNGLCIKTEYYPEQRYEQILRSQTTSYQNWIGQTKYKTHYYYENIPRLVPKERVIQVCCKGYANDINDKCVPICPEGCLHGVCSEPNRCTCDQGYTLIGNKCQPDCGPLECGDYGTCVAPEICKCEEGFQLSKALQVCTPSCQPECVNSTCAAPNQCNCFNGYVYESPSTHHRCKPHCVPDCSNGDCVEPNVCQCFPGFKKVSGFDHECIPHCPVACIDPEAFCGEPGKCLCLPGYELNEDAISCRPICSKQCENGYCNAPDTCICQPNYEQDEEEWHRCVPSCSLGCINANCTAPDNCTCHEGHEVDIAFETGHVCLPICQLECINANCTAPDECTCYDGYEKDVNIESGHVCVPVCSMNGCQGGFCIEPETCMCYDGYFPIEPDNMTICELNCSRKCIPATCQDLWDMDTCKCPLSYTAFFPGGLCLPDCLLKCKPEYEDCEPEPDCLCKIGFKPDNYGNCESLCPNCDPENGRCNHQGECVCKRGYTGENCTEIEKCHSCPDSEIIRCQSSICGCEKGWKGPCQNLMKNCFKSLQVTSNNSLCVCTDDGSYFLWLEPLR